MEKAEAIRRGILYGDNYLRYKREEVERITDIEFLNAMQADYWPYWQPQTDCEYQDMCEVYEAICKRIDELQK